MKSAERSIKEAQVLANVLVSDLSRHRAMLDVDPRDAEWIVETLKDALVLLDEKYYNGKSWRLPDVTNLDERVLVHFRTRVRVGRFADRKPKTKARSRR